MNTNIAEFASKLNYQDLPNPVITTIKHSFIDAIACSLYGSTKAWSEMTRDVVVSENQNGTCFFPSFPKSGLPPSSAALLLGSYCHAFELDNLRFPGAGVHPGAVIICPLVALAREHGLSGKKLISSAVVGIEALSRLGLATKHSLENRGFHAPGVIGPVGGAIACAAALGANQQQIINATGIAASMSAGLLAFAKSDGGGMIK
ncbi:MAG: MmgE/PrpD family protein, partial [Burkholderiaceae bacterium]